MMEAADDGPERDAAKAEADKMFLIWVISRSLSATTGQKLPGISGFTSATGNFAKFFSGRLNNLQLKSDERRYDVKNSSLPKPLQGSKKMFLYFPINIF